MGDFGKQLIVIGLGKVGLDKLFAAGPAGGPAAIAAGIGLVALAGVAGAVAKSASSSLGNVTGSSGGAGSQAPQSTIKVVAEFRLRGEDLVAIGQLRAYRNTLTS